MIDIFYLKLLIAFIVSAAWITTSTMLAERFGSKIGGIITGIPSVIVITLFFIAWTQSTTVAAESTNIVPVVLGIDALFVAIYILFLRFNFLFSVTVALLAWFVLALGLVAIKFNNFPFSLLGCFILVTISYVLVEKVLKVSSSGQQKIERTIPQLLFRAVLSGIIVCVAVIMTKIGGPILGGAFATFPAIMLSTMIITYLTHGKDFSAAVMKTVMISGPISCLIYVVSVRFLYPFSGLIIGTVVSFVISLIGTYAMYLVLNKRLL
jgi:hypothetical protein